MPHHPILQPDLAHLASSAPTIGLAAELDQLRKSLKTNSGLDDFSHLKTMSRLSYGATATGLAFSWIAPNPISVLFLSMGNFSRWTILAHHILHKGYDHLANIPSRFTSHGFARGWRRLIDWFDVLEPEAWRHEHNDLHHYRLGETRDPDQPEQNTEFLRAWRLQEPLLSISVIILMMTWKWLYYAPNLVAAQHNNEIRKNNTPRRKFLNIFSPSLWLPWTQPGRRLWFQAWAPYFIWNFIALPLAARMISPWAFWSVLINLLVAEILTNVHSFLVIVPNHGGGDLYRFEGPARNHEEFYLRQIRGSANYTTGSDALDFFHGFLNYQIEHHLWPDLTLRQYQQARPQVKALCQKYGVAYIEESVFRRFKKLFNVISGKTKMSYWREGS